jgi:hypothetical protein
VSGVIGWFRKLFCLWVWFFFSALCLSARWLRLNTLTVAGQSFMVAKAMRQTSFNLFQAACMETIAMVIDYAW